MFAKSNEGDQCQTIGHLEKSFGFRRPPGSYLGQSKQIALGAQANGQPSLFEYARPHRACA